MSQAQTDLRAVASAMDAYVIDNLELPPPGDFCNTWYCLGSNASRLSAWNSMISVLIARGYLKSQIGADPWGNSYGYDDNYVNSGAPPGSYSILYTTGPNGQYNGITWSGDGTCTVNPATSDDYCQPILYR